MARYKVIKLEKVAAPEGAIDLKWYKFIIENDKNTIVNIRSGSKNEVYNFALESVKRLNEKYFTNINFKSHRPVYEVDTLNQI